MNKKLNFFEISHMLATILILVVFTACTPSSIKPSEKSVTPAGPKILATSLPTIQFTIQVGAFSTPLRAAQYANHLQVAGLKAFHFIDADGLSKVRFERFETKEAARIYAEKLKSRGLINEFFIVHPGPANSQIDPKASLRKNIVETAYRFIGTPYRWGGSSVKTGFDCSGLTMTVYHLNGLSLPRNAHSQYLAGIPVPRKSIQRGDLVFFKTGGKGRVSHVGIYSGQGMFIHAPGKGKQIRRASLSNTYFKSRYSGARRYF